VSPVERINEITRGLFWRMFAEFCMMALIFVAGVLVLFTFGGNQ